MKAQTKALIASVVVIALALSAVSGVTYSWWSDSENTEITVTTGYVKVETSGFKITNGDSNVYTAAALPSNLNIGYDGSQENTTWTSSSSTLNLGSTEDPDDLNIKISYKVKFDWTVASKYVMNAIVPSDVGYEWTVVEVGSSSASPTVNTPVSGTGSSADSKEYSATLAINVLPAGFNGTIRLINTITQANNTSSPWYGLVDTSPFDNYDTETVFKIETADQLAGFAKFINENTVHNFRNFFGKTVTLLKDIDLNGIPWTPIGLNTDGPSLNFAGTFNGNGKTISNMKVDRSGANESGGLFGATYDATIKNLNFENASVINMFDYSETPTPWATAQGTGVVVGSMQYGGVVEGINVSGSTVKSIKNVGGITGYMSGGAEVINCTVCGSATATTTLEAIPHLMYSNNLVYDDGDKVGGIVGVMQDGSKVTGCTVSGVTVTAYRDYGGIAGSVLGVESTSGTGCTVTDNTVKDNTLSNNQSNYSPYNGAPRSENNGNFVGRVELNGNNIQTS